MQIHDNREKNRMCDTEMYRKVVVRCALPIREREWSFHNIRRVADRHWLLIEMTNMREFWLEKSVFSIPFIWLSAHLFIVTANSEFAGSFSMWRRVRNLMIGVAIYPCSRDPLGTGIERCRCANATKVLSHRCERVHLFAGKSHGRR